MLKSYLPLCQRMLIGAGWIIAWRAAVRAAALLSDCGWIIPIRSHELAEVLRYLNAALLVAAGAWSERRGRWRPALNFSGPREIARNHCAPLCIVENDRRSSATVAVGWNFFHRFWVEHFMIRERHDGTSAATSSRSRASAQPLLASFDRRLAGDSAA